jgi:hypothetical protein
MHVRAVAQVEPDRLHQPERDVRREHVGRPEHAGVLLDHGLRRQVAHRVEVALDARPCVRAVLCENRRGVVGRLDPFAPDVERAPVGERLFRRRSGRVVVPEQQPGAQSWSTL